MPFSFVRLLSFDATGGGQVLATTFSSGDAGDIFLNVTDTITISGRDSTFADRLAEFGEGVVSNQGAESGVFANTTANSTGEGGRIFIDSPTANIRDGGRVAVNSQGSGLAGDIEIDVGSIRLDNQGEISAETFSSGGGNIGLRDLNRLQVNNGKISASTQTGQAGSLSINANAQPAQSVALSGEGGLFVEATEGGTAGNLTVNTQQMTLSEGAQVTVSSPEGLAGNIDITADSIFLNQGRITAETGEGEGEGGANIFLKLRENLIMRNESLISATAFEDANGGNITLDARFIIALPPEGSEGSDIIANAFLGDGGRVNVTADYLFNIDFRDRRTPLNDITASSEFGNPGVVTIDTPGIDPNSGLVNLPTNPGVPQPLSICQPGAETGNFVNTGLGGFPINPDEPLGSNDILEDLRLPTQFGENATASTMRSRPIVEAKGWIVNEQGQVVLVAEKPSVGSVYRCGGGE